MIERKSAWRLTLAVAACVMLPALAPAAEPLAVHILYLEQKIDRPPTLSNLDPVPADLGVQGARLGIIDSNTTGKFLKLTFDLTEVIAGPGEDIAAKAETQLSGFDLAIVDAPAKALLALADLPEAKGKLLFDAGSPDEALREADCRANVLHTLPTRSMLTDALVQFLVKKQWKQIYLLAGGKDGDKAYASALESSAAKFGAQIVGRKDWATDADVRRTAAEEVPLATQASSYDVVAIADESDQFGNSIAFNTWLSRATVGTHGLVPTGWSPVVEAWGAAQLQGRFKAIAKRPMRDVDFAAWLAVRVISEAVLRTGKAGAANVREFALSPKLLLSAFKGRGLSFRPWNGQVREPIHLVTPGAQIALAPIEGYLHQRTDLDTLGPDQPETKCKAFGAPQ